MADGGSGDQVTRFGGGMSAGYLLAEMNRKRRIRRMRRVVIASADCSRDVCESGGHRYETLLVTLTYRPDQKWARHHVSNYCKAVMDHCRASRIRARYQWVMELTQKGVPHYHVLWWLPFGTRLPMPDASGMWPYGFSRIERARRPVGYLVKYATKGDKDVYTLPKGARLFGVGGGLEREKLATHRAGLPMWLLERLPDDSRARKVARVGWVCLATGEIHSTPFSVRWSRDSWGIVTIEIFRKGES